jgi:hypothetical protein
MSERYRSDREPANESANGALLDSRRFGRSNRLPYEPTYLAALGPPAALAGA